MLDHPIVILIILVAALLRWLAQRSGPPDSNQPKSSDEPIPRRGETQSEEERIRRFLEALGQPTTSTPPPKVTRRSEIPKRVVKPQVPRSSFPLPPLTTAPPPLVTKPPPLPSFSPSSVQVSPPPTQPVEPRRTKPPAPLERGFEVRDLSSQAATDPSWTDQGPVADRRRSLLKLASTQDLRRAIVLREVFGPPRSLQVIDPISGF